MIVRKMRKIVGLLAISTFVATTFVATMPFAASAADRDAWALENGCSAYVPVPDRDPNSEGLPIREVAGRVLAFARKPGDTGARTQITLRDVCSAVRLPLRSMPLPPPRAEPWNPDPLPAQGATYIAILRPAGSTTSQFVEYTETPSEHSLKLSLMNDDDPAPFAEPDRLHADMGQRCELRGDDVRAALEPAGFTTIADFQSPAAGDTTVAHSEDEPSVRFTRGTVEVSVTLQGSFRSQRAQQLQACVAGLTVGVRTDE